MNLAKLLARLTPSKHQQNRRPKLAVKSITRTVIAGLLVMTIAGSLSGCKKSTFQEMSYKLPKGWVAVQTEVKKSKMLEIGLTDPNDQGQPRTDQKIQVSFGSPAPETKTIEDTYFSSTFRKDVKQVFRQSYKQTGRTILGGEDAAIYDMTEGLYTINAKVQTEVLGKAINEYKVVYVAKKKMTMRYPRQAADSTGFQEFLDSISFK